MTRYSAIVVKIGSLLPQTRRLTLQIQESLMTILAIVNASKEGQIESKMMKSRQMEEIREARRIEAEARLERKKSQLV